LYLWVLQKERVQFGDAHATNLPTKNPPEWEGLE
jgi:hypothetical protein